MSDPRKRKTLVPGCIMPQTLCMLRLCCGLLMLCSTLACAVKPLAAEDVRATIFRTMESALRNPEQVRILVLNQEIGNDQKMPPGLSKLKNLVVLDLSQNVGLFEIPPEVFELKKLKELRLERTPIRKLPPRIGQLTGLRTLDLADTDIQQLPAEIGQLKLLMSLSIPNMRELPTEIRHLTRLRKVRLAQKYGRPETPLTGLALIPGLGVLELHDFRKAPPDLCKMTDLRRLLIKGGDYATAQVECIGNLTNLTELVFSRSKVERLPESIGNLKKLRRLELYGAELPALPDSLVQLDSLETFEAEYNAFTELPSSFGRLRRLRRLKLNHNKLKSLPGSFRELAALEELDCQGNDLTELPTGFGKLRSLRRLQLADNNLTALPDDFGELQALEELTLGSDYSRKNYTGRAHNRLKTLPATFSGLRNLQILKANDMYLVELPDSFGNLAKLRLLNLRGNELKELPQSFSRLGDLEDLRLDNNQLSALPPLDGMINLRELFLSNNQLSTFPVGTGRMLRLERLLLHENRITAISTGDVAALPATVVLVLSGNRLSAAAQAQIKRAFRGREIHF